MSPSHWIITNRRVETTGTKSAEERVAQGDRRALPIFRVARFTPLTPAAGEDIGDDALVDAVRFVPDDFVADYEGLDANTTALEGLPGTQQVFLDLYRAMRDAPAAKGDVLFFIHGFDYSWLASLRHLQKLHQIYVAAKSSPVARIVYFAWPSHGDLTRYLSDLREARESGWLLGRLIGKLDRFHREFFDREKKAMPEPCGKAIHLAAHSMGNQVLEEALRALGEFQTGTTTLFREALLLNADIEWTALEAGKPLHRLPDFASRINVYNHESDDALRVSRWTKHSEARLGSRGPKDMAKIPPRTIVVDSSDLRAPSKGASVAKADVFAPSAASIEPLSPVSMRERLFDHWGYLYRREVIDDIHAVLRGESAGSIAGRDARGPSLYRLRAGRAETSEGGASARPARSSRASGSARKVTRRRRP